MIDRREPYLIVGGAEAVFGTIGMLVSLLVHIPQQTKIAIGLVALLIATLGAATIFIAPRIPCAWGVDMSLAIAGGLIALSTTFKSTAQGQMSQGMLVLGIGVVAATIRPTARVITLLAWLLAIYNAAWLANPRIIGAVNIVLVNVLIIGISAVVLTMAHRLHSLAQRDPLTGTLNRWGLEACARRCMLSARAHTDRTLLVIDLDDFKGYNDRHGHAAGDALLVELATAWRACLSRTDALARIGGDEFAVVLRSADEQEANLLIKRLRDAHQARWSYGIARWGPSDDLDASITSADKAMYAAKHPRRRIQQTATHEPDHPREQPCHCSPATQRA